MRFARIVMLDFEERDLEAEEWAALRAMTTELVRCRSSDIELGARLEGADALLVQLGVAVGREMLEAAPRLRYVGVFGTSTGRVDLAGRSDIVLRNVPGFSTEAVAELAIGIFLDHLRDLSGARARAKRGDFSEGARLGGELRGRRVGLVGVGAIGRRVAEIARDGFGADVRAWSRTPRAGIPSLELEPLLRTSEIVSVHLPLTRETRGLLHADRVASLADGALLVHLSPPELLDVPAIIRRLRSGTLHFVTDHADEMDPGDVEALRDVDACVLYPPIAYGTGEAKAARRARFLAELRSFLER